MEQYCTGVQHRVNSSFLQVCGAEITRQIKPEVAEIVRSRTANFNLFRSDVDLSEALIGTVCMDNSFWIQKETSR